MYSASSRSIPSGWLSPMPFHLLNLICPANKIPRRTPLTQIP